jgi:predicted ATP-grasp superfamily ATP-dependent carboligase
MAADWFTDEDLVAACACLRIDSYPEDLERAAETFPPCPWLYTGGLENYPQLVDRIADQRVLLGNPGHVLREVRDPFRLAETLRSAGLPTLQVAAEPPRPEHGTRLRKPRRSGGGRGIEFVSRPPREHSAECKRNERHLGEPRVESRRFYYQQYVAGTPCSAVFVGAQGKALWLGATQQLIGTSWTGARGFEYAGSLGPLDVRPDQRRQWERIGHALAGRFGLSGLFGVDAVMTEDAIWVVEVNPRYTASVEVIELACDVATMVVHVLACRGGELPEKWPMVSQPHAAPGRDGLRPRVGKAIIYARTSGRVPTDFGAFVRRLNQDPARPAVADISPCGREFSAGEPLVTALAYAPSLPAVEQSLRQTVASVQAALGGV